MSALSLALHSTVNRTVNVLSDPTVRQFIKIAVMPATIASVYLFNKYLLLDGYTNLAGIVSAVAINTFVLNYFHMVLQNYWTPPTKKIAEKREVVEVKQDTPLDKASKEYDDALEKLEAAINLIKANLEEYETKTKGKEREVEQLRKDLKAQEKVKTRLYGDRNHLIRRLLAELKKVKGFDEYARSIEDKLKVADLTIKNSQISDEERLRASDELVLEVIRFIDAQNSGTTQLLSACSAEILRLQEAISKLEKRIPIIDDELKIARATYEENLEKKNSAAARKAELLGEQRALEKAERELNLSQAEQDYQSALQAFALAEQAHAEVVDKIRINKVDGTTPPEKETPFTYEERLRFYSHSELSRISLDLQRSLEASNVKLDQQATRLRAFKDDVVAIIAKKESEIFLLIKRWISIFNARLAQIPTMTESALNPTSIMGIGGLAKGEDVKIRLYFQTLNTILLGCLSKINTLFETPTDLKEPLDDDFPIPLKKWPSEFAKKSETHISGVLEDLSAQYQTTIREQHTPWSKLKEFYQFLNPINITVATLNEELISQLDSWDRIFAISKIQVIAPNFEELKQTIFTELRNKRGFEEQLRPIAPLLAKKAKLVDGLERQERDLALKKSTAERKFLKLQEEYHSKKAKKGIIDTKLQTIGRRISNIGDEASLTDTVQSNLQAVSRLEREKQDALRDSRQLALDLQHQQEKEGEFQTNSAAFAQARTLLNDVPLHGQIAPIGVREANKRYNAALIVYEEMSERLRREDESRDHTLRSFSTKISEAIDQKEKQKVATRKAFEAHQEALKHVREQELYLLRLSKHKAMMHRFDQDYLFHLHKSERPSDRDNRKKVVTRSHTTALEKSLEIALQKMQYHSIHGKKELVEKKHELTIEVFLEKQRALSQADQKRVELAKHRLKRQKVENEWRVLSVGSEAIIDKDQPTDLEIGQLKDLGPAVQAAKKTEVLDLIDVEIGLVCDFYKYKIKLCFNPADKEECLINYLLAILELSIKKIYVNISHINSDKRLFDIYDIIAKIHEALKPFTAAGLLEKLYNKFVGSENDESVKGLTAYVTQLVEALERDAKVNKGKKFDFTLENFHLQLQIIARPLMNIKTKQIKTGAVLVEIRQLFESKLQIIQHAAKIPFRKSDFEDNFEAFSAAKVEHKKAMSLLKMNSAKLEADFIRGKKIVHEYLEAEEKAKSEAAAKEQARAQADESQKVFQALSIEHLSYLLPAGALFIFYAIFASLDPFPTLVSLSFRASRNILVIGMAVNFFTQGFFSKINTLEEAKA